MRFLVFLLAAVVSPAEEPWSYLSYFGGAGGETIQAVRSDGAGGTFFSGTTSSVGPPFTDAAEGYRSNSQAFVARVDAAGRLVFATLLGDGSAPALAVDADGNVYVAGVIQSSRGFSTDGVFQPEMDFAGGFLAKFNPAGEKLFATYFGGRNGVQIRTLTLDGEGRPIFCGYVRGNTIPLKPADSLPLGTERYGAFCAAAGADGTELLYSRLVGAPSPLLESVTMVNSAAMAPDGNLVIAGTTPNTAFAPNTETPVSDQRRTLFRAREGEPFEALGGPGLGSIVSVQVVGKDVFAGTLNNGAWASGDGGTTWRRLGSAPSGTLVVHPNASRFMCVYFTNTGMCSRDGGTVWQPMSLYAGQISMVADPRVDGGFFVASTQQFDRVWYVPLGSDPSPWNLPGIARSVTVNAAGDRIFATIENRVYFSEDRGATYRVILENAARVAVAPGDSRRLYATRAFRTAEMSLVVRSDDGGATWVDMPVDQPFAFFQQMIVDPADADTVYVVTGAGAYRSTDGARSWQLWTPAGLSNTAVQAVHFDDQARVWAGTGKLGYGFVAKLKAESGEVVWQTMVGGVGGGYIGSAGVSGEGRIYFSGFTLGADLPVTGEDLAPRRMGSVGFIGTLDASGRLQQLRHTGLQSGGFDVGANGVTHLLMTATPADIGDATEVRGRYSGGASDVVWLVISPELTHVTRATWLGGDGADTAGAIAVGRDGRVRLTGSTFSRNLPVTEGAMQRTFTLYGGEVQIGNESFLAIAPE